MHVPMIIHFPRGEFGGRRVGAVVSLVDIAPTVLDFTGAGRCDGCRGTSLLPLARGDEGSADRVPVPAVRINRNSYYRPFKQSRGDVNVAMRRERWKAIWNPEPRTLELYDLVTDPDEHRDRSRSEPALAAELRSAATNWLSDCKAALREPAEVEVDLRLREKMHALGYAH
jgi:arylsulfatase A-like enzyme